jgi:L,D-transpeptidase YcbB
VFQRAVFSFGNKNLGVDISRPFTSCLSSKRRRALSAVLLALAATVACGRPAIGQDSHSGEYTDAYGSPVANLLRDALAGPVALVRDDSLNAEALRSVYESRNYEPIWTGSSGGADLAGVLDTLRQAETEGLRAEDYRLSRLTAMHPATDEERKDFELLITDSLLRYARDIRFGRVRPADIDADIALPDIAFDVAGALASAVASGTLPVFLADLAPKHPEYQRLKQALERYRAIEAGGGWATVSSETMPQPENGGVLRVRLAAEDPLVTADGDPVEALKRYQTANGLTADGLLGPRTLAALNIPVATRIKQIAANMERWRWMPRELEPRRIMVNVADAMLQFIDNGSIMLESKVVVGQPGWRTPILRAEATAVTVNPVWHVPRSIAQKEIWPKLRRDPSYLESEGFVVVGGQIRQLPGPTNALGQIKLEMPNDFGVYLHDTPAKSAFSREMRALSHGCIRVEQIVPLVLSALSGTQSTNGDVTEGELSELIATGNTMRIDLGAPIPVYLVYSTAIADEDGRVAFRTDAYDRDRFLIAALDGQQVEPRAAGELDI